MTNFEKYFSEIKEIAFSGNKIAKDDSGIRPCEGFECIECDFFSEHARVLCSVLCIRWMCEEYIEHIKLTAEEKAFLSIVKTGWIARDQAGRSLYWYSKKPERGSTVFDILGTEKAFTIPEILNLFKFIRWEDEPYSVEKMLTWEVCDGKV